MRWEINGSKGTIVFDAERANELEVNFGDSKPGERAQGFRTVLVSEAYHPYWQYWWPHGHMIGWEDNFVHELLHLLTAIKEDSEIGPHGATFEDGYRCAEICDAIVRSHESRRREEISCRAAARQMIAQGDGGRIINVTSIVDIQPIAELTAYVTAKGGILGLTKTLAVELGPHGITVNAISPGATDTPLNQVAYTPDVRRNYEPRI